MKTIDITTILGTDGTQVKDIGKGFCHVSAQHENK